MGYLTPNNLPEDFDIVCVPVPKDTLWQIAVYGAISSLVNDYAWEQYGEQTPQECADYWFQQWLKVGQCMATGTITPYVGELGNIPEGYLVCDGQTYQKVDYPDLWEVIDGGLKTPSEFTVPDLRNKFIRGAMDVVGSEGSDTVTLSIGNLPPHTHGYSAPVVGAGTTGELPATSNFIVDAQTASVGAAEPFSIVPFHDGFIMLVKT